MTSHRTALPALSNSSSTRWLLASTRFFSGGKRVGAEVRARVLEVLRTDGQGLAVVGARLLDLARVGEQRLVERAQCRSVGGLALAASAMSFEAEVIAVVVLGALGRRLQPADQEGVGGVGIGLDDAVLDGLDPDQLVGVGAGPGKCAVGRAEREAGRQSEHQAGDDRQGSDPPQLPGRALEAGAHGCRQIRELSASMPERGGPGRRRGWPGSSPGDVGRAGRCRAVCAVVTACLPQSVRPRSSGSRSVGSASASTSASSEVLVEVLGNQLAQLVEGGRVDLPQPPRVVTDGGLQGVAGEATVAEAVPARGAPKRLPEPLDGLGQQLVVGAPPPAGSGSRRARRRCSPRTRWWCGTDWPDPGSRR